MLHRSRLLLPIAAVVLLLAWWSGAYSQRRADAVRVHFSTSTRGVRLGIAVPQKLHSCAVARLQLTNTAVAQQTVIEHGMACALFVLNDLALDTRYVYRVLCAADVGSNQAFTEIAQGTFHTLGGPRRTTFAFGSCIWPLPFTALRPFSFMRALSSKGTTRQRVSARTADSIEIDFFLINGDAVYADSSWSFRSAYGALWADDGFRRLTRSVSLFTMFDDHEYSNDAENAFAQPAFHRAIDAWRTHLGRTNPPSPRVVTRQVGGTALPRRHDYAVDAGATRMLVLDTFSHRDSSSDPCTLLGLTQRERMLAWLAEARAAPDVEALFIVSPLPASVGNETVRTWGLPVGPGVQQFTSFWQCSGDLDVLLEALEVGRAPPPPLFLLSGDLHYSRVLEVRAPSASASLRENSENPDNPVLLREIVSAPLYNFMTESSGAREDAASLADADAFEQTRTLFESSGAQHVAVIDVEPSKLIRVQLWRYGLFTDRRALAWELEVPLQPPTSTQERAV